MKEFKGVEGEKSSETLEDLETLMLVSGERVSNTWIPTLKWGTTVRKGS